MSKDIAFILYNTPEYSEKVQVVIREETLWMTQKAMSELFGVDKSSISRHLKNIFESGELDEKVVVAKIETTTQHGAIEGKTQYDEVNFYNQLKLRKDLSSPCLRAVVMVLKMEKWRMPSAELKRTRENDTNRQS